jgi:DNA repair protein RadC
MRGLKKEIFKVVYLNSQNQVIEIEDLFQGTVDSSVVHIREVIESAIKYKAVSMIFVHNHPSGNPAPSQSDKDLTRDLVMAAGAVGLKVLDHIVIGDNKYYSFSGEGLTERYDADFNALRVRNRITP